MSISCKALLTKKLSPLEHKYVIRTLMQDMKVGVGLSEVLNHYSPLAMDLWHSFNNLKELCALLSDPDYVRLLQAAKEKNARLVMESYKSDWMPPNPHRYADVRATRHNAISFELSPCLTFSIPVLSYPG